MKQPEPFGQYLLYGQVAVGGMAEIYKARFADPSQPQVDIALKRILPSYTEDESFVTMFKDEGIIARRLDHPNIVHIYDVGEVNGDWYIAMEFVHGTDIRVLSDACEKYNKRFTFTQIARVICDTAKALYYAHTKCDENGVPLNIVHRDCTPHNIMCSQNGEVKLMDFGIAKAASRATKTRVGTVKGKSSYMSPEQARGKNLDGRSDMFTLATVGWELLTGYRLFKANSDFEILTKVLKSEIHHPSDVDSNVPRKLGDLVMKALERDRDLRYEDCGKFADALENWITVNGDGSDRNLGDVVLALQNKQGHSPQELPDYHPGESLYTYEDGEFIPKVDGQAMRPVASAPVAAPVSAPAPTYPDPAMMMAQQQPQSTSSAPSMMMIVAFVILLLITIGASFGALSMSSAEEKEPVVLAYPDANILVTTKPDDAIVKVNGEVVERSTTGFNKVASTKVPIGSKVKISVEKEGYVTYESERELFQTKLNLEIELKTEAEVESTKRNALPKYEVKTNPEGAMVSVNGVKKGKSPITLTDLPYGEEVVLLVTPDGNDYAPKTTVFYPYKNMTDNTVIELAKVEKAPAKVSKPKPVADKPKGNGILVLYAIPWAKVSVDGVSLKTVKSTPIKQTFSAGNHKVEYLFPPKGIKVNKTVTVKANESTKVGYNFNASKWY